MRVHPTGPQIAFPETAPLRTTEQVDSFGCFGNSSKPTPKVYSLIEIHEQIDSLPSKTASDLVALWHDLPVAKREADLEQTKWYAGIVNWKRGLTPDEHFSNAKSALLNEITERFLSGQRLADGTTHLSKLLDQTVINNVVQTILGRVYKAKCYHNVKLAGVGVYKSFDQDFMRALCGGYFDKITGFFEEARANKIQHQHLFQQVDFSNMPHWAQDKLAEQAKLSGTIVMEVSEVEQRMGWVKEYNQMLKDSEVPEANWMARGVSQKDANHGYRLAALYLHPDHNPKGAEQFKRLAELAELVGTKDPTTV